MQVKAWWFFCAVLFLLGGWDAISFVTLGLHICRHYNLSRFFLLFQPSRYASSCLFSLLISSKEFQEFWQPQKVLWFFRLSLHFNYYILQQAKKIDKKTNECGLFESLSFNWNEFETIFYTHLNKCNIYNGLNAHKLTNEQKHTYRTTFIIASNKARSVLMRIDKQRPLHWMIFNFLFSRRRRMRHAKMVCTQSDLILTLLCGRGRAEVRYLF